MTTERKFSPFLDNDKLPWGDFEAIIDGYKRNVELLTVTQQIAIETTKSVIQLQAQYMKQAFDQFSSQAEKGLYPNVNDDKARHQPEFGKETIDKAVQHATKINTILNKSNEKIIEKVQKRFNEGLKESAATVKKTGTKKKKKK